MKIHLLSDLHLEFVKELKNLHMQSLVRPADVLVLAGDIQVGRTNVLDVLKFFSRHYPHVIYITGNHEYYGGLELNGFNDFSNFGSKLPSNVYFLGPGVKVIDDVTFIGATLWTNFREDPMVEYTTLRGIVDFHRIPDATIANVKQRFYHESQYIKMQYENNPGKKAIVTHFLPAVECISPRWQDPRNLLNGYFANDMGGWISSLDSATWLFGHTHDAVDVTIGETRCLARPYGYPGEHTQSYEHLILEV